MRTGPRHRAAPRVPASDGSAVPAGSAAGMSELSGQPAATPDVTGSGSFHDEVLRTTADLDAMLALAGVTGAGVAAGLAKYHEIPDVPDTAEGAEQTSDTAEMAVVPESDYHDPRAGRTAVPRRD
jgi:hypothetical protein